MHKRMLALGLTLFLSPAMADDGIITLASANSAQVILDRYEALAREKGMKIFARIDHAAGARSVGKDLRPTELLVFGNPRAARH